MFSFLQELKELRMAGVRTFADAEQHEAEHKRAGSQGSGGGAPRSVTSDQVPIHNAMFS